MRLFKVLTTQIFLCPWFDDACKARVNEILTATDMLPKWFEPMGISFLSSVIVWVRVVFT